MNVDNALAFYAYIYWIEKRGSWSRKENQENKFAHKVLSEPFVCLCGDIKKKKISFFFFFFLFLDWLLLLINFFFRAFTKARNFLVNFGFVEKKKVKKGCSWCSWGVIIYMDDFDLQNVLSYINFLFKKKICVLWFLGVWNQNQRRVELLPYSYSLSKHLFLSHSFVFLLSFITYI